MTYKTSRSFYLKVWLLLFTTYFFVAALLLSCFHFFSGDWFAAFALSVIMATAFTLAYASFMRNNRKS